MDHKLNLDYIIFFKKLQELINGGILISKEKYETTQEIDSNIKIWESKIISLVEKSITPIPHELINNYKLYSRNDFFLFSSKKNYDVLYFKQKLNKKIEGLEVFKDYLSIINSLRNESITNLKSVEDKIFYILNKLYKLYGDYYYSVELIFKINNIEFKENEPYEISENLRKRGSAIRKSEYSDDDIIKISVKGAAYIERKNKSKNEIAKKEQSKEINQKIDLLIEKLEELKLGQEIIFNELEDFRTLSKKIPKKNWGQLLKGKIIELVVKEVLNKETASFILKSLTDSEIKFLK